MQFPVDIKAVFDEATNIDAASQTSLSVSIYMDETAPGDIQALVRQAFASASPFARVSTLYFPTFPVVAAPETDMAVIVAGLDENVGRYCEEIRAAGVPVMVVTTLPELVCEISQEIGHPLLRDDIIGPAAVHTEKALSQYNDAYHEPYALTEESSQVISLKMGEWIIDTCKEKRLAFALAFGFVRKPLSREAVNATSAQNAGVGLVAFIPGADMPIMTLNQAKMLLQIAAAYGQAMNADRIKELAAVVGGAFVFRSLARQAVAFVPALGWVIKAAIGYTGTYAMGHAAIEYFEGGGSVSGLMEVVDKARAKVMNTAGVLVKKPKVKTALQSISSQVSAAAQKAAPVLSSVVDRAVGSSSQSATAKHVATNSLNPLGNKNVRRFKKD